jgi:hypothetical protein
MNPNLALDFGDRGEFPVALRNELLKIRAEEAGL